jgi:hypothetical protein
MKLKTQVRYGYLKPTIVKRSQTALKDSNNSNPFLASIRGTIVEEGTPKNRKFSIPVSECL